MKRSAGNMRSLLLLLLALCLAFAAKTAARADGMSVTSAPDGLLIMPAPADESEGPLYFQAPQSREDTLSLFEEAPLLGEEPEKAERFITITLHAGEYGCFGDPSVKEKETVQFRGEALMDHTVPDALDDSRVFVGWATEADAAESNVIPEVTHVSMIGTDLYAVWTDECLVYYQIDQGYLEADDGQTYSAVLMSYKPGASFKVLQPKHFIEECFDFDGWYTGRWGQGISFTGDTVITEPDQAVYAKWKLAEDRIEPIEEDKEYELEMDRYGKYFVFRPEETTVYLVTAQNGSGHDYEADIIVMNADQTTLAKADIDTDHNAAVSLEMKAGEAYFVYFREMGGQELNATAKLSKAECVKVTFHANAEEGKAWFDGDEAATEKQIDILKGENVSNYLMSGLEQADEKHMLFEGWSADPEAEAKDDELIAEEDMDVYAVYRLRDSVTFDANGGYFSLEDGADTRVQAYDPSDPFAPSQEPRIDDNTVKFAGWSRDPDAEVPDEDIVEGVTGFDEVGDILYAVYTEKLLETFNANGGYLLDDPTVTSYQTTKGKGHIFFGLSLFHENKRFVPIGWTDQNGEFIPYTSEFYPFYHVEEDTVYTAVWGYKVYIDTNGGFFPEIGMDRIAVTMELDGLFSFANVGGEIGECINYDENKYLAGWATAPDTEEPDVFEGVTKVRGLDWVYAVWKDDSYILEEGGHSAWEKGSADGLRFVVKRAGDDRETFPAFNWILVDGEKVPEDSYTAEEGSLILTLKPEYLETLKAGAHELVFDFIGYEMKTDFTVKEKETEAPTEAETTEAAPTEPESTAAPEPEKKESFLPPAAWYGIGGAAIVLLGVILLAGRKKKGKEEDENDPLDLYLKERQEHLEQEQKAEPVQDKENDPEKQDQ